MFIKNINTFNEIILSKSKPLVICDIDDTILYYKKNKQYFYELAKNNSQNQNKQVIIDLAYELFDDYKDYNKPLHTDYNGFIDLLKRIDNLDGKLIFLTSRNNFYEFFAKENFNDIGLNYDEFEVHYTNAQISKGEYIYNFIRTDKYNNIIFIDDRDDCINSVLDYVPYIDCYKFIIKSDNT